MKNDRRFVVHSKMTSLKLNVGHLIKMGATKLKVHPEQNGTKYSLGCYGCYFNSSPKREEHHIPKCECAAKDNETKIVVHYESKNKEYTHTAHDLYCACTGNQSLIYKKNINQSKIK